MRGDEIRTERTRHGWSQPQLAQLVGVSKSLISMWETEAQIPGDRHIEALMEAFLGERGEPDLRPPGRPKSPEFPESHIPEIYRRQPGVTSPYSDGHVEMTADVIRTERKRRKWTQQGLADRVGGSRALVADWEISRRFPNEEFTQTLQRVFSETPPVTNGDAVSPRRRRSSGQVSAGSSPTAAETISVDEMKAERKLRGWTQQKLSDYSGVSRGLIGNWESGARGAVPNSEQSRILRETFDSYPVEDVERTAPRTRSARAANGTASPNGRESADNQSDMPWVDAIERVLKENGNGKSMRIADIAQAIIDNQYRVNVGVKPANSVSSNISIVLKRDGDKAIFVRDGEGVKLRSVKAKPVPVAPVDEAAESAAELGLIRAFGFLWARELVNWKLTKPRLLGVTQDGASEVDFSGQAGVYVLYDISRPVYVGKTDTGSLGERLRAHTKDPLAGRWSRFSWFAVKETNSKGALQDLPAGPKITFSNLIKTMEALLIEALEPPRNRKFEVPSGAEFIQREDPDFIAKREEEMLMRRLIGQLGQQRD